MLESSYVQLQTQLAEEVRLANSTMGLAGRVRGSLTRGAGEIYVAEVVIVGRGAAHWEFPHSARKRRVWSCLVRSLRMLASPTAYYLRPRAYSAWDGHQDDGFVAIVHATPRTPGDGIDVEHWSER